jgi:hypothetical protein
VQRISDDPPVDKRRLAGQLGAHGLSESAFRRHPQAAQRHQRRCRHGNTVMVIKHEMTVIKT